MSSDSRSSDRRSGERPRVERPVAADSRQPNGWNEYSKLVLKELETLADGIDDLRGQLHSVKQELVKIHAREDRIDELRDWKRRVDDITSPKQFALALREVEELKQFKTKAVTVFAMVQFAMAVFALIIKFIV